MTLDYVIITKESITVLPLVEPTLPWDFSIRYRDQAHCSYLVSDWWYRRGLIYTARMLSWYFNQLILPWIGASLLLRVIQCHYYCIHIFHCQATIRNLQPMFCCIYFAHCAFTLTSMYCGKTLSNYVLFMVKEVLY